MPSEKGPIERVIPAPAQPRLGGGEQGVRHLGVLRLEHPPLAEPRAHMLEHELVDLRRDAPDHAPLGAGAEGEEEGGLGMLEPGVLARRDQPADLVLERRHPVGIGKVQPVGELDKGLLVGLRGDLADGNAHGA